MTLDVSARFLVENLPSARPPSGNSVGDGRRGADEDECRGYDPVTSTTHATAVRPSVRRVHQPDQARSRDVSGGRGEG